MNTCYFSRQEELNSFSEKQEMSSIDEKNRIQAEQQTDYQY